MRILFVGDVMLGRLVNEILKQKKPEYPWGDTLPVFKKVDLRICNLECVITDTGEPIPQKTFHFRTDQKNFKTLLSSDMGMVSLANNHILDFNYEGMLNTMKILGSNAINYAGVGMSFLEASEPAICDVDSKKIGLIAFTDNEPEWEATDKKPGIFYVPVDTKDAKAASLFEQIKKVKKNADILIVSAHWGPNWGYEPPEEHIPFAHAIIDAGADVVFGHSGHVFRGIEVYKNKPILYCAGNFIDDYAVDEVEKNNQSFIFILETDKSSIKKISLYPTVIKNLQANLAKEYEQEEIIMKMQNLCSKFGTKTAWKEKPEFLEVII
nr:CapA family protein [Candidatus Levybacteria bacterium]